MKLNSQWAIVGICCLHVFLLSIFTFTAWPEMLAYPRLIQNGYSFYGDIIHPYLQLLPYVLSLVYKTIGFSLFTLKLITLFFLIASDLLIYQIAKKKYSYFTSILIVCFFVLLSVFFEGNGLWFDLASLPFVLAAFYLSDNELKFKHKWLVGLLLGFAFLIKQTNSIFMLPLFFNLKLDIKKNALLVIAFLSPLFLTGFYYFVTGHGKLFFNWGIIYPIFILPNSVGFSLMPTLKQVVTVVFIFSPLIFIRKKSLLLWGFILALIFALPRFAYFHLLHASAFFVLLLPLTTIYKKRTLLFCYISGFFLLFILFGKVNLNTNVRFFDNEVLKFNQQLTKLIPTGSSVYFYNVSSNYWVFSNVMPVKPWADHFPWYLEQKGVQENIVKSLETVDYVVYKGEQNGNLFELGSYKPKLISEYINKHFVFMMKINDIDLLTRKKII